MDRVRARARSARVMGPGAVRYTVSGQEHCIGSELERERCTEWVQALGHCKWAEVRARVRGPKLRWVHCRLERVRCKLELVQVHCRLELELVQVHRRLELEQVHCKLELVQGHCRLELVRVQCKWEREQATKYARV